MNNKENYTPNGLKPIETIELSSNLLNRDDKEKLFSVWVGDGEVNDYKLTQQEALRLANEYLDNGYDDVQIVKD